MEVAKRIQSRPEGLSGIEATERLVEFGPNERLPFRICRLLTRSASFLFL
jgi:hypothetical protein